MATPSGEELAAERKKVGQLFKLACTGPSKSFIDFYKSLLPENAEIDLLKYKDGNKRTVLHFAAHSGQLEITKQILKVVGKNYQNVEKDAENLTPFGLSVRAGHADIMKCFLVSEYFDKKVEMTPKVLDLGASTGNFSILKLLIENGCRNFILHRFNHGSVLQSSIFSSSSEHKNDAIACVKYLLSLDVKCIEITDDDGVTAPIVAAAVNSLEILKVLASFETEGLFELKTNSNENIFHTALSVCTQSVVEFLLQTIESAAELLIEKNSTDKCPLDLLVLRRDEKLFELVLGKGCVVKARAKNIEEYEKILKDFDRENTEKSLNEINTKLPQGEAFRKNGNELFKAKKYKEACEIYSKGVKLVGSLYKQCEKTLKQLFYQDVMLNYQKDILNEVANNYALLLNNQATTYLKLNKTENALTAAKVSVEVNKINLKSYYRLGQAYEAHKMYAEAAQAYWDGYNIKKEDLGSNDEKTKKMLLDLFQQAVEKGKSHEKRKAKLKLKAHNDELSKTKVVSEAEVYDHVKSIEVPDNKGGYKELELKFNNSCNEIDVAVNFIKENGLDESLVHRIAKHIYETKTG